MVPFLITLSDPYLTQISKSGDYLTPNTLIYRTAPFSTILSDGYPDFKVTPLFDAEYLRTVRDTADSFNGIPIGTFTRPWRPTQKCHFE